MFVHFLKQRERDELDKFGGLLRGVTVLVDTGRAINVIYLGLCKTFDTVWDHILVSKLERQGFDKWSTRWIRNWLDGLTQSCSQQLYVQGTPAMSGVPQGSRSGPTAPTGKMVGCFLSGSVGIGVTVLN